MKKLLYKKVYEKIETKILNEEYKLNEKLPSEKELADEFNVSTITIKRALTELKEDGYISRKPKEGTTVISTTKNPDISKSNSITNPIIGLVVTNFDETFGTGILNGILEEKSDKVHIIVKKSLGIEKKENEAIKELLELNIHGLILLPSSSKYLSPIILDLASQQFPMVMIDRTLDNLPISSITTNNIEAAEIITTHLIELGHKNIGLLTSSNLVSSVEERIQGYVQAHAANHVTMDPSLRQSIINSVIPNSHSTVEDDIKSVANFIKDHPNMTAIFATEYNIALIIKQACLLIGKKIPEDLSVVCFDHPNHYFDKSAFTFTHIEQKQYETGKMCINQLLQQINEPDNIIKNIIKANLVIGDSTTTLRP